MTLNLYDLGLFANYMKSPVFEVHHMETPVPNIKIILTLLQRNFP